MARGQDQVVLRSVRTLFVAGAVGGLSDGELLDRSVGRREADAVDEGAFQALVDRHGPMVLGICRRVLRNSHDTEDAFQATFLILVRNQGSIRRRESLGHWLAGVARRVAVRAKVNRNRRHRREQAGTEETNEGSSARDRDHDGRIQAIYEAVAHLPEKYRTPVELCYFEGRTYEEVARLLSLTEDTVRGRLARARERLRARLKPHDVALSSRISGAVPTVLPTALVESTCRLVSGLLSGDGPSTCPASLMLAKGVIRMLYINRLITIVGACLAASVLVLGSTYAQQTIAEKVGPDPRPTEGKPKVPTPRGSPNDIARVDSEEVPLSRIDPDLSSLIDGHIVRSEPISKDCMILCYMADWSHGNVDNIGVANNDGGVRTLLNWPEVPLKTLRSKARFYVALYSRKTTLGASPGPILACSVLGNWPERASWTTMPEYDLETKTNTKFTPGEGWKLVDVTHLVRLQAQGQSHGAMLRFLREDRSGVKKNWSGYEFVSSEGTGEWKNRRPLFLSVEPQE
ncbi:sigma-70 family RNA polymerase sigma factor [Singulisphaera rosea]